jgi:hypothetical protein
MLSAVLCVAAIGFAIRGTFYDDALFWHGDVVPAGYQDAVIARSWAGRQVQIWFQRTSFALAMRNHFRGVLQYRGLEFQRPAPIDPITVRDFRKEHHLFGLFSFELDRIDYNLGKDFGRASSHHIIETGYHAAFPLWFPAFLLGLFPAILFFRRRGKSDRSSTGICQVCGYDLRATPDRCPECGTVPPKTEVVKG